MRRWRQKEEKEGAMRKQMKGKRQKPVFKLVVVLTGSLYSWT